MPKKAVITGAGGQLAADLARCMRSWELYPLTHDDLDVTNRLAVEQAMRAIRPHTVINTAAFHRVDECEKRVTESFAVNDIGARNLARACVATGATLVHISTDYVFRGDKGEPYVERDMTGPLNVYGLSKLAGEVSIRRTLDRHLIVRTSGLYGAAGASGKGGGNFVTSMLKRAERGERLRVVDDQRLSPTYTAHLARKIVWLLENEVYGLVHITNSRSCTWYEFTRAILDCAGVHAEVEPVSTPANGAARRPAYSVLGHAVLASLAADNMPPWQEALARYLLEIGATSVRTLAVRGSW